MKFVEGHKKKWGVEPCCTVMQLPPSTYYATTSRPPSRRSQTDQERTTEIQRIWQENKEVYGADKVWWTLQREGKGIARCTVERLMRQAGLRGVVRGKRVRTTIPAPQADRPQDLVKRVFRASAPNRLWVADITYVKTHSGWVYVAFVIDVYSRAIVGWQTSRSLHAELALDALEMALWRRGKENLTGLIHHSDRGIQYVAFRYTKRLEDVNAVRSVGSKGDSYDNALVETINGLYKAEVIRKKGPWKGHRDVEYATLEWVDWYNSTRLQDALGRRSPHDYEETYHASLTTPKSA